MKYLVFCESSSFIEYLFNESDRLKSTTIILSFNFSPCALDGDPCVTEGYIHGTTLVSCLLQLLDRLFAGAWPDLRFENNTRELRADVGIASKAAYVNAALHTNKLDLLEIDAELLGMITCGRNLTCCQGGQTGLERCIDFDSSICRTRGDCPGGSRGHSACVRLEGAIEVLLTSTHPRRQIMGNTSGDDPCALCWETTDHDHILACLVVLFLLSERVR